jgi:23S rRNA (uracil1939-C5)-methyltransferase
MDSLGQGVSKLTGEVTFIPKTAIGDKGDALVVAHKKKVQFARVNLLRERSELRIDPFCRHFEDCPSCHYQHLTYEDELRYKEQAFRNLFRRLPLPELNIISSSSRAEYRNRIQLHYSLKSKLIGMLDAGKIIPIPNCLIGVPQIQQELNRLYTNQQWLKEAPDSPLEGHLEIYWVQGKLQLTWNKAYAEGGFTQVNQEMNSKLKSLLSEVWGMNGQGHLLDLFAGNGNLSEGLNYSERLCVDHYPHSNLGQEFFHQNLYASDALGNVLNRMGSKINRLLLDPPRSGLKNLSHWLKTFSPEDVAYVSCDPHTLVRDLAGVEDYRITRAYLLDFFPSTFHFESLIFLVRKS